MFVVRDPDEVWRLRACNPDVRDPDLWSESNTAGLAVHFCLSHCPLLKRCRQWAEGQRWDGVVIAGIQFTNATGRGGESRPVRRQPQEELCERCKPDDGCSECGEPIVDRGPAAKICGARGCEKARAARHRRRYEQASRQLRTRCAVCRSSMPAGTPEGQRCCAKEKCREMWQTRQDRVLTAGDQARLREQVLAA